MVNSGQTLIDNAANPVYGLRALEGLLDMSASNRCLDTALNSQ